MLSLMRHFPSALKDGENSLLLTVRTKAVNFHFRSCTRQFLLSEAILFTEKIRSA